MYAQHTSRTARIASIIEKRRPLAEKIAGVEANLKSLASALRNLEDNRDRLLTRVDDANVIGRLKEIDFSSMQLSIAAELEALGKLGVRFSRDTLNIGVVGRARQGKSRLLQSLTGLTAAEIPDGDRQHCTGVRSTIHHNPNVQPYGEVWFHSERSFLDEVIAPYYERLCLGTKPITLDEFASQPLPPLPNELRGSAEFGAMYEHLDRYHSKFEKYRHLLRELSPHRITTDEIREYVAQDNLAGERIYFNYLAVREVKIVCNFPNAEVGQIALVDMPGLGDTGVGDAERLVQTLGQDVDAVLFVRMPKPDGDYWADVDVRLYDIARAALVDLPINLWSFLVLNHKAGNSPQTDNFKNCQDLAEDIVNKHINVSEWAIANCANAEEANKVLDRILDYLSANIAALDKQYASSRQERIAQLQSAVEAELDKARDAFGRAAAVDNQIVEQEFSKLFGNDKKGWWKDVALGLEKLRSELWLHRQAPNNNFQAGVDAAIQACQNYKGILSSENPVEEINERIMVSGSLRAYADYRDEIRVLLSHHFLSLDEGLKKSIENVKSQVADVLIYKGNLGVLTDARGAEFIKELNKLVNEAPSYLKRLKQGLEIFSEFELSYRGLMQHRIRKHLDGLTNIIPTNSHIGHIPEQQTDTLHPTASTSAEEILLALQIEYETAVNRIIPALEEVLWEPNQAAYAMVEEFVDNIIHQEDIQEEWKNFLRGVRSQVWQEELGKLEQDNKRLQNWLASVKQAKDANAYYSILFLN